MASCRLVGLLRGTRSVVHDRMEECMTDQKIGTQEEWQAARDELLRQALDYTVAPIPGQRVTFYERTEDGMTKRIGRARGRAGRIVFTPVSSGQPARIEAAVEQNTLPRDTITIARSGQHRRAPSRRRGRGGCRRPAPGARSRSTGRAPRAPPATAWTCSQAAAAWPTARSVARRCGSPACPLAACAWRYARSRRSAPRRHPRGRPCARVASAAAAALMSHGWSGSTPPAAACCALATRWTVPTTSRSTSRRSPGSR